MAKLLQTFPSMSDLNTHIDPKVFRDTPTMLSKNPKRQTLLQEDTHFVLVLHLYLVGKTKKQRGLQFVAQTILSIFRQYCSILQCDKDILWNGNVLGKLLLSYQLWERTDISSVHVQSFHNDESPCYFGLAWILQQEQYKTSYFLFPLITTAHSPNIDIWGRSDRTLFYGYLIAIFDDQLWLSINKQYHHHQQFLRTWLSNKRQLNNYLQLYSLWNCTVHHTVPSSKKMHI